MGIRIPLRAPTIYKMKITRKELVIRLREARRLNREAVARGEALPNPTKEWSKDSFESLKKALGGKKE